MWRILRVAKGLVSRMLKILIADDHPLYREALIAALQTHFTNAQFLESDSFDSVLASLRKHRTIGIILLDLNMPGCDNYYALLRVRQSFPNIPVIVVSGHESLDVVAQSMEFGAQAFIPKTTVTSDMIEAIKRVLAGGVWLPEGMQEKLDELDDDTIEIAQKVSELTPKQFQVLRLVKQGMMNKQIADFLNVTEATVKAHISTLFKRLDVKSRTQILVAVEKLQID